MIGVLLSGKAGSGKDTIADILVKEYGFKKYSFADALKQYCSERFKYPIEWNYSQEGKQKWIKISRNDQEEPLFHGTIRDLLIEVGQQMRYHDELYWVKRAWKKINKEKPEFYVISDLRFINEADFFKKRRHSVYLIRVNADYKSRFRRLDGANIIDSTDVSETQLDNYNKFDIVVYNNDGDDVYEIADFIYKTIKEKQEKQ